MKYEVKNRWTGDIQFTAEIECDENSSNSIKLGLAVNWAIKNIADLTDANLYGANLYGADLYGANLYGADLTRANLTDADLTDANLTDANLTDADLTDADLTDADLTDANLTDADLTKSKNWNKRLYQHDFLGILLKNKHEIDGLVLAIKEGRIDGSVYSGECACLMGTIANIKKCDVNTLTKDSSSPIEQWFLQIKKGDTPENSNVCKKTLEWIEEFKELMK